MELFKGRLSKYYGVSKDGRYIHPDTLNNYITDISGFNRNYLNNITKELSEERFVEFVNVIFPELSDIQLVEDIDPSILIAKNGYAAGARLLRLQDPDLSLKESFFRAKEIERAAYTLNSMTVGVSYTGDPSNGFGIASYEARMNNGDLIRFDFMNASTYINNDDNTAVIDCHTLDTAVFPESEDIDINEIDEITNIVFDDDGDYARIKKIDAICLYANNENTINLKSYQLETINKQLASN